MSESDISYTESIKNRLVNFDEESATLLNNATVHGDDEGSLPHPSIWRVNVLLFVCGLTTFARTEV